MGQLAYHFSSGKEIEAFCLTDDEWNVVCRDPLGTWLIPKTNWPAVPKISIRGLKFFVHKSGYPLPLPKPKSYAHTRLQIDIVNAARNLGYKANLEVSGTDSLGSNWIADILVEAVSGHRVAFEVQLSTQHLSDFRLRTERYQRSGVSVCWLLSETVAARLAKSIVYENMEYYRNTGTFLADCESLITFGLSVSGKDKETYPSPLPALRFSRGKNLQRLELSEVIQGMMLNLPKWQKPNWIWGK